MITTFQTIGRDHKGERMSRLYLLRHARAAWPDPGMNDFDRPLTDAGVSQTTELSAHMHEAGLAPSVIICSTARRARETWRKLAEGLLVAEDDAIFDNELYTGDASDYVAIMRRHGTDGPVMIVGHNPMMEDTSEALAPVGKKSALSRLQSGFSTCGLAIIDFDEPLDEASPGTGRLTDFIVPARA